jgi:CheY-like chemotaxis protein
MGNGHVLLIEDDDDLREAELDALEGAGIRVVTAREGREALDLVEREMPGVIFLDMRMPGMDGWAFAREFRSRHGRGAPIVVTTAAPDALKRAEEIDAEGVLAKPFEAQRFIELAQQHLAGNAAR